MVSLYGFSQINPSTHTVTVYFSIKPTWIDNSKQTIMENDIFSDSVYYYSRAKHNKDSTLIMTQYFDSLGNLLERDEFNRTNGQVIKITNNKYIDTFLVEGETEELTPYTFSTNSGSYSSSKIDINYEYNKNGKVVTRKENSYFEDSLKHADPIIYTLEYNDIGFLSKEFVALHHIAPYLHCTYHYTDNDLTEVKAYDYKGNYMYSYIYEYDKDLRIKTSYLQNANKTIQSQIYFDAKGRIIEVKKYGKRVKSDHSNEIFNFDQSGLLTTQSFRDIADQDYFYKHHYSKK